MSRFLLQGNALVIALSLLVVGCDDKQPAATSPVSVNGRGTPGKLFDPLEFDKDIRALKKPGHWQVKGQDSSGAQWEGYLVVEHTPNAYLTSGFFDWSSQPGGGRYRFEGTYNPDTRALRWIGYTVENRFGRAANAQYQATLSPDGRKLLNGSWQGGISVPGTWSAEFLHE